ncbi:unnamed protein product [Staurois parvus]|uniref:Uncharacterized protein n=1 Tax=Staurois parvus TaxID=386267 RepID=A0ABN9B4T5_9NEOB|nr:unnamed protein product [Staurois parvus]
MLLPGPECVMGPPYRLLMLLPGPLICHGPLYPPPHAAARSRVCHGSLYGLPLLLARPVICHGAPYRLLMLLPRPVICHGPLYPPPHAAARSRVCHGSLYGLPLPAVSIATLCHVPLSGLLTLLVVSIFVIGCCMASIAAAFHRHTVAPHSGFGPVTAQMSEVCGDSKIDALICMSY